MADDDDRGTDRVARLADLPLTYRQVGATGHALPEGWAHLARNVEIGHGRDAFERAGDGLMTWEVHRRAGNRVHASAERAAVGVNVAVVARFGLVDIEAPCRVVHVVEQPDRLGFTYGTLRGHPVSGEESFSILLDDDGTVRFVLISFSKPATWWAKLGGPIGRMAQAQAADRYAAEARRLAAGS